MLRVNKPLPTRTFGDNRQTNRRRSAEESEGVPKEIGCGHGVTGGGHQGNRSGWNRRLAKDFARSALGAIFDLLGELFDLLGFFYEGDGEGGVCVGMLDLVL